MKKYGVHGWWACSLRILAIMAILAAVPLAAVADSYDDGLEKAVLQYSDGNYDEALVLLDQISRQTPERKEAHLWMGRANEKMKVHAAAIEAYKRYLAVVPQDTETMLTIARIYKGQGKPEPAQLWLQRALENEQARGKDADRLASIQSQLAAIDVSGIDAPVAASTPSPAASPAVEVKLAPQAAVAVPAAPKPTITVVRKSEERDPVPQAAPIAMPATASSDAPVPASVESHASPRPVTSNVRWGGLVSMVRPGGRVWVHIFGALLGLGLLRRIAMAMAQHYKLPLTDGELARVWMITLASGLAYCAGIWGIQSSKTMVICAVTVFLVSSGHRMAIGYLSQQRKQAIEKALDNTEVRNKLASLIIRNVGQKGGV